MHGQTIRPGFLLATAKRETRETRDLKSLLHAGCELASLLLSHSRARARRLSCQISICADY